MTIRNRELSQFGSFIYIDNDTKDIGISTLSTPFVGIGTTNATSKFHVYGDTKLEGDLNLTGVSTFSSDVNFDTNLNVSGVSTFAGAIDANGDLDVDGQTELDDLNVSGVSTFASNVDLNSDLDVDGQTELDDLNVSGVSTFTGAIDANGDLDVDGQTELDDLNVSGITTTSGLLDINAGGQANTFKVEDLTDNRVVIVGSGGELEDDANLTFNGTQLAVGVDLDVDGHTELDDVNVSGAITATTFTGDLTGNAGTATSLETARDFSITGDFVTAPTVSFDGTGNVSLAATITTDSIELGTYTSGDYVASISGTANQVSVDVTSGEGTTPTISLPNNVELPGDLKVTSGLTTVSSLTLQNTGVAVTAILDEDGLTSDRDDALATQQSIKAYVDDQVDLQDLDVQGDTGGALSIDLDTEILTIAGTTNEIETVGSGNSITVGLSDEVSVITSLTVGSATTITGAGIVAGIVTASLDGNAGTATSLETARDFSITGDFVTAPTVSFDGTGVVALGATLTENSVVLGTYTSGDYVQSISGTANEIEVTGGTGESSTPQIGLPDDVTIGGDLTVTGLTTTNTLYVAGVSTFNGVLNTNSSVSIGDTVNATAYYQNGSLLVDVELQQWEDATGSDIYREFGNVGIGTSTNLAKLSVNGQIESQVTSGTAPFIVQSQTTVENLSAKLLDGKSAPTGSIVGTTDSQTLTTKTINLSNNTLSGTTAEFNTALSDDDFATLNNSVTLTNKTLTSPVITSISNSGTQTVPTGTGTLVSTNSTGIITTGMIDNLTIVNNDISNSANINYSKLNLSGSIVDGDITTGTIANDKLVNSTISGISLGSNLSDLTRGTDVLYSSGTTYNGSSGITISVDSSTAATSNKIVKRDADGGITANDITAGVGYTFYGDGSGITGITADVAVKIATADTSTAASFYPTFVDSNNTPAQYESLYTDGGISYNPSTGDLTVGGFVSATGGFNIGIQSGGIEQTTGVVTAINFIGAGNTFNYNAGTKTIDVSIESGSGGDSLWESYEAGISTTSNVGIGTTNPEAKLSIDVGAGITALDIQGSEGQLFSVTNNLTSGSIFSVNDVSGFPSIDVDADGTIQLALYGGNVGIATTNPTSSLDVNGTLNVTGVSTFQNNIAIGASIYDSNGSPGTDSQVLSNVAGIGVSWIDGGRSVIDILDDIGGSFDGIIVTFNLTKSAVAYTPVNAQSLRVVLGGVVQEPITDYTVSGTQITFTTAPAGGLSISIIAFTATELEAFNASDINSGVLDELYGGTGNTTYATGDILYSSAANTLSKLTVGSASSVLTVSGGVPVWAAPTGGGGGEGGSGTYDTGITTSIYVSVGSGIGTAQAGLSTSQANNDIFIGPGIAYTFPATAGKSYVIESIQVTNIYNTNLYFTSRHDFDGGENVPTSQRVIIPYQGALELLDQPIIANPSDILNFQAFAGVGTDATGINNGLDSFIVYSEKTDTDYIGTGATIVTTAGTELFTSTTNPSVLQSIRLCNYDLILDVDASVSIYRGGSVGGILTTGVRQGYLVYNLTIPKNSVVEILEKPKYLATNDTIVVGVAGTTLTNSLSATLSGKYIV